MNMGRWGNPDGHLDVILQGVGTDPAPNPSPKLTMRRQSAALTRISGTPGEAMGRASGLSFLRQPIGWGKAEEQ